MKNLQTILKQFAAWHPDMLHTDTNKRFYLIKNIVSMADFTTTLPKNASPCVAIDLAPDMVFNGLRRGWRHTIYFLVKADAKKAVDTQSETDAIEAAYKLMNTFNAWCNEHYMAHDKTFLGLMWDGAQAYPYGPLANGWYAACLDLVDERGADDRLSAWSTKGI